MLITGIHSRAACFQPWRVVPSPPATIEHAAPWLRRVPLPACQRFDRAATIGKPSAVRPCRKCADGFRQPSAPSAFDLSQAAPASDSPPVRHHRRKRGVNARRCVRPRRTDSRPSRRAAPLQARFSRLKASASPAPIPASRPPFARAAGSVRRGDRVPRPASGLSAVRPRRRIPATVRAVRFRSIASRARFRFAASPPPSPETRRKRPPLRPPTPDGFAPVPPCRALASPFQAV